VEKEAIETLKADALIDIPWKNGGGITRRIAKEFCACVRCGRAA